MGDPEQATRSHESAQDAVSRLLDEHGGKIFVLASKLCGSSDEAQDLLQEVFFHAFRSWEGFRGDSSEKTWLYTIAAHACQRMHRKRKGEPDRIGSLEELLPFSESRIGVIPADQSDALQQQINAEALERMEGAITRLPDAYRVPLILKEIVGFSVREVGQILGMQEPTARSRIHRARLKLRAEIDASIPRSEGDAPPPTYPEQTCLDLLNAKQEALDRGVPFTSSVICDRCRSVFASLDLAQDVCRQIGSEVLPQGVRDQVRNHILKQAQQKVREPGASRGSDQP